MRILEINTERGWRGGERQTFYNLQGMRARGIEIELLCRANDALAKRARLLGVAVHEANSNAKALQFLIMHGRRFNVIHPQTAKAHTQAIISKFFHHRPVVYTRRAGFPPQGAMTGFKYHRTDRVVAISLDVKTKIESGLGIKNIAVIPDAVVPRAISYERARQFLDNLNVPRDKKIVATVAALTPEKDAETLVKAIGLVCHDRDDFVFLHFGDGPLRADIDLKIQQAGLSDRYRLMGFVDDIEDFYSVFDVFVSSSSQEGLGSSVIDAFLYGVPVVSTDAGGLRELVEGRGLLCSVGNSIEMARLIQQGLDDSQWREQAIVNARTYAQSHFSLDRVTNEYLKIFSELAS